MAWELVPFIWLSGMALIWGLGTCLKDIEEEERKHLFRKPYPSEFTLSLWGVRGSEEYQNRVDEWFRVDAIERHKWKAGQPARNRQKWQLRIAILVIGIVSLWALIGNLVDW